MDLRLATLKAVSFYLLHNVSTLIRFRKFSCVTGVCKQFASYQGYPNYRWDLTVFKLYAKSSTLVQQMRAIRFQFSLYIMLARHETTQSLIE
jgi:hypothetical protein